MMNENDQDKRWKQRLSNFQKAYSQLKKFIVKDSLSELEIQGLVKAFEYTNELSWNTMRDYLLYQGFTDIAGSRDTIREAFSSELIYDGEGWMDMLKSRNQTSHIYNEKVAQEISDLIKRKYFDLFKKLLDKMETL